MLHGLHLFGVQTEFLQGVTQELELAKVVEDDVKQRAEDHLTSCDHHVLGGGLCAKRELIHKLVFDVLRKRAQQLPRAQAQPDSRRL